MKASTVARQNVRFVELIHDLTQRGYRVEFSHDFTGMVNLSAAKNGKSIGHWHLGTPYGTMKDLEAYVRNHLAGLEDGSIEQAYAENET